MPKDRSAIPGSHRPPPSAPMAGEAPPDQRVEVSVYLKPEAHQAPPSSVAFRSRSEVKAEREANLAEAIRRLQAFAKDEQLSVGEIDAGRRLVKLRGTVADLERAFGTSLQQYDRAGAMLRVRTGELSAPADVVEVVEAVLGLDQRPIATPKSIRLAHAAADVGFLPNAVTALYGFPTSGTGEGEAVAIIELGGGFNVADTEQAFQAMGLKTPDVAAVAVSGGANQPGKDTDADGEVALDIQVAGAGAPGGVACRLLRRQHRPRLCGRHQPGRP